MFDGNQGKDRDSVHHQNEHSAVRQHFFGDDDGLAMNLAIEVLSNRITCRYG